MRRRGTFTISVQPQPLEDILRRIRGEYIEMPGHRLTVAQAQRLWGLDRAACDAVLGALVYAPIHISLRPTRATLASVLQSCAAKDRPHAYQMKGKRSKENLL